MIFSAGQFCARPKYKKNTEIRNEGPISFDAERTIFNDWTGFSASVRSLHDGGPNDEPSGRHNTHKCEPPKKEKKEKKRKN